MINFANGLYHALMKYRILGGLILVVMLACCSEPEPDARLQKAASLVDDAPFEALDSLSRIDRADLSERDCRYCDFLKIKATDKAYLAHDADSLIMQVVDFAERHDGVIPYHEALYYAGRVYSDLGDYATALDYYHQAIAACGGNSGCARLKSKALSQAGWIYNKLRLYESAELSLKNAIEIERQLKDSLSEVYDLQLLGATYLHSESYNEAQKCIQKSLHIDKNIPEPVRAKSLMYLAWIEHKTGHTNDALTLIRHLPDSAASQTRNSALAYAALIYNESGILDTACMYAHELLKSNDILNKRTGYQVIFSPEQRKYVDKDTLLKYITEYHRILENDFDDMPAKLAIDQHAKYNYQYHDQERERAEKHSKALQEIVCVCIVMVLMLSIVILYLKNRHKGNVIKLHLALEKIDKLKQAAQSNELKASDDYVHYKVDSQADNPESVANLRNRLLEKLQAKIDNEDVQTDIPSQIIQSDAYKYLQARIERHDFIRENDDLWVELESAIFQVSPKFKETLQLLARGNLSSADYKTSMLIKCGIQPTKIAMLLNLSKSAIASRRRELSRKAFGENIGLNNFDNIIRLI